MQAVSVMKGLLLEELGHIVRTSSKLIAQISPEHRDYRPRDNMRSLLELAQHLVSIPSVDLLILREQGEPEIRRMEAEVNQDSAAEPLSAWMDRGLQDLKAYMEGLSEEDFLYKSTKPFYLEHGSVQAKWLIEIVTHAQHHRAQLFNYMKELGYKVNMFDLY
ncbi:putative damage-inducible protein DinB [Paenibacillus forsythiae]|uniref:Damage-inducible protein DinB n=1 Tax=Paenibacillus forsythiae TaxID=365616 RepID=A0ABU3HBC5_9BACL|nr:DinB family protein [Paenibacillus forsythiae]MDT3428122.1 putative damage-inducible protein DinB [Paenibacillus forsythiae]